MSDFVYCEHPKMHYLTKPVSHDVFKDLIERTGLAKSYDQAREEEPVSENDVELKFFFP